MELSLVDRSDGKEQFDNKVGGVFDRHHTMSHPMVNWIACLVCGKVL